jgi:hypothetical protein
MDRRKCDCQRIKSGPAKVERKTLLGCRLPGESLPKLSILFIAFCMSESGSRRSSTKPWSGKTKKN